MEIYIEKEDKLVNIDAKGVARAVLESIGVNPETVLIIKDGALITEADEVDGAKRIELLSVVSGG